MATARSHGEVGLDTESLARVFDSTTNSYKFLLFLGLLDALAERPESAAFPLREVLAHGLARALRPVQVFRLRLGGQDQVVDWLRTTNADPEAPRLTLARSLHIPDAVLEGMARYVPTRLLRPFFADQLRGVPDHQVDNRIRALSLESGSLPLYRLRPEPGAGRSRASHALELPAPWRAHLKANWPILEGWALYRWVQYLQVRNPFAPAIAAKLEPPERRAALTEQRAYWAPLLRQGFRCIYSRQPVGLADPLDHFVPWSFVGTDSIWNLVPVSRSSNSEKADRLPDWKSHGSELVRAHVQALMHLREKVSPAEFERLTEAFVVDLRMQPEVLREAGQQRLGSEVSRALEHAVVPLLESARLQGFEPWSSGHA